MSNVCPKCDEPALSTESERTCLNCGFVAESAAVLVQDKVTWVSGENYSAGYGTDTAPKTHLNRHHYPSIPKGRTLGKKLITRVGLCLSCNTRMIDDAKALYDQVFNHDSFHCRRMKTKTVLAAACFYIVCRQFEWAVTLHDIADVAQCCVFQLDRCKKQILETFGLEIKSVDLLELAEARCEKADLGKAVISSVEQVIKLCRKLWISEGRNPENIVSAACFVAWQGEEPSRRLKTNFRAFCKLSKFTFSKQGSLLVSLIQAALCELAKQIPWVGGDSINPSHVALHLKDIVKFQNTLIAGATADDSCGDESDSNPSDEGVSSGDESGANSHSVSDRKPHLPSTSTSQHDSSLSHSEQSNKTVKSGKRLSKNLMFFSKRSRATHTETNCKEEEEEIKFTTSNTTLNMDNEELGNEDIHDDDLHMFIKTEAEVHDESSFAKTS